MSDIAIKIDNVGKLYQLGQSLAPYSTLREEIGKRFHSNPNTDVIINNFWALKDISFTVKKGEVLGIIGSNGAGKSTLLKILSRITSPTEGKIICHGRVGSLLEVGTGFHPELTGKENIYLNGSILGMKKKEIDDHYEQIIQFSEIKQFINTPVKRYSSGMYVRLAFSIAAHLDPEILLVDEVLAVGDADFQKKCLEKMNTISSGGRTILFVSHNMSAVQSICTRCLWINKGTIVADGDPSTVIRDYLSFQSKSNPEYLCDDIKKALGNDQIRIKKVAILPEDGIQSYNFLVSTPLKMIFEYWNLKEETVLNLSIVVTNEMGVVVFNTIPIFEKNWTGKPFKKGLFRSVCHIPGFIFNDGIYKVTLYVVQDFSKVIFKQEDIINFEVFDDISMRKFWYGKWIGVVRTNFEWETKFIQPQEF